MSITTITSKGQITIPKDVRQALDLKAHDRAIFTVEGNRAILTPVRKRSIMNCAGHCRPTDLLPIPKRSAKRFAVNEVKRCPRRPWNEQQLRGRLCFQL